MTQQTDVPGTPARILITATANETVVAVAAELDLRSTAQLRERLADELALRPRGLIVDLTRVTFCSVAGLSVLAEAARLAEAAGVAFVLAAGQRAVLRPIRVLRLDAEVTLARSVAEAVELVSAARRTAAEVS
ncbi:STAS domain-containing protein [Amycolatopsis benzoatilytica]|uniref:STAS domain-containing protein n=1 Tax=Amycolatopsis benzoatilytica TaxID=346045 RepID=UPI00037BA1A0|nr:STAS domain-containing protein [Amycolatopsis benzoatilytica]